MLPAHAPPPVRSSILKTSYKIRTAHVLPAQQYLNEKLKQLAGPGGIKLELAILQQSTTLSKLSNGTLNVA